jgi:hypothetical protein
MNQRVQPFVFCSEYRLVELTGLIAVNLAEFLGHIRSIHRSSIFYHTHQFFFEHHFAEDGFNNDFARWTHHALHEYELAEQLNYLDITSYKSVKELRRSIIEIIEKDLRKEQVLRQAVEEEAFHFCKSKSFVIPSGPSANNLKEFIEALYVIPNASLFFHLIESRLRVQEDCYDNDFSIWLSQQLGKKEMADAVAAIDPYFRNFDKLRHELIETLKEQSDG